MWDTQISDLSFSTGVSAVVHHVNSTETFIMISNMYDWKNLTY